MINGYKIIDFKGIDVSQGETVKGIYDAIKTSTKPLVIYNLNVGYILPPFFSAPYTVAPNDYLYIPLPIATPEGTTIATLEIETNDIVSIIEE